MSYHAPIFRKSVMSGLGSMGHLSGVNDKVEDGEEVTFRFRPGTGVNAQKGDQWAARMAQMLERTGHYEEADYKGWGAGTSRGLIVVRVETKHGTYTLQELANFAYSLAEKASLELSMPVTFLSAVHGSDEAFVRVPGGGGGGGGGGGPATPETPEKGLSSTIVLFGVAAGVGLLAWVMSRKG